MKVAPKSVTALFFFVATIYVMRNGDQSFLSPLTKSNLRNLAYNYARPSSSTCDGVSLSASFSSSDRDRVKNLQNSLEKNRGGNPFQTMLEKGSITNSAFVDYAMGLIPSIAVWAAFFVISVILCCCGVCNWCCMFGCCKNCKCCRCCKAPEGTKRKRIYLIVSLVFMVGLFSAGIAGAVYSGNVSKGMKVAYCSAFNFVEDFAYGVQGEKWLGLKGLAIGLLDVATQFSSFKTSLNSLGNAAPDNTILTNLKTALTNLDSEASYKINRVDPASSTTQYAPDWFKNLGPSSDSTKVTYGITNEAQAKFDALNKLMAPIKTAIDELTGGTSSTEDALNSGQSTADSIFNSLDNTIGSLNGNGKTLNDAVTAIGKAIMGIFIAYIIIALLPIASILLIVFLKIKFFSKILHVSWCLMGILAILGFLVSAVFYPISIVFVETCGVLVTSMNDEAFFSKTLANGLKSISQDASDLSYTCIFGDGDALKKLGVDSQVGNFDIIYKKLDEFSSIPNFSPDSSTSKVPTVTVPPVTTALNNLKDGFVPDGADVTTDLGTLNSWVNTNTRACATGVLDTWALNHAACPSSGTTIFANGAAANSNLGSATCIGVDYFAGNTGSGRYSNNMNTCTDQNEAGVGLVSATKYVQDFVDAFLAHRSTLNSKVNTLTTSGGLYDNVLTANDAFETDLYSFFDKIGQIRSTLDGVKDSLTGATSGIIPNTNCHFIGTDMRNFTNALCYGFIFSLFQSVVVLIVVSMFSLIGSICVFCLAKRILNEDGVGVTKFG